MILSFHPMFPADNNLICAGRLPGDEERLAIQAAAATILPQGCRRELYEMACRHCRRVFPNYTARFDYPGKIGQARLFQKIKVRFPASVTIGGVDQFKNSYRRLSEDLPFPFPFVVKFDWGGEGETVSLVESVEQMEGVLKKAADFERAGLTGFLMQEFIPCDNRVLRVVVIGSKYLSYWRKGPKNHRSCVSVADGAKIDFDSDPVLQQKAIAAVKGFSQAAQIDLAGFDMLYTSRTDEDEPYFLEINYFFGRRGLGGSEAYYALLCEEICHWLDRHGLTSHLCDG